MPSRRTNRGAARTALSRDYDVLVCGASFAGLAVARELAGVRTAADPARVLVLDRYDVGERQTSACAAPTELADALGLERSIRQTFSRARHPHPLGHRALPPAVHLLHLRLPQLCSLLDDQNDADVRDRDGDQGRRSANGRGRSPIETDRGECQRPLVVDALGWRRVLESTATNLRTRRCRAGWRCIRTGNGADLEIWIERSIVPAGYGWSFPAGDEVRVGVGSFDPRFHVKEPTVDLCGQA